MRNKAWDLFNAWPVVLLCIGMGSPARGNEPEEGHARWSLMPDRHKVGHVRRGETNNHGTHYLFGMSAIPVEKGEGFYKNTLLSVNAVNYGLTRHLSVGAGVELISVLTGREGGPIYFLDAKLAANVSDVLHVGVNAFYINYPFPTGLDDPDFEDRQPGFGVLTGAVTVGDADIQMTVSGGISRDLDADLTRPAFSVSGLWRLLPRMALISENWLFLEDRENYVAASFGVRFIGANVAIDLAVVTNETIREEVVPVGLPILNVAVAF